MKRDFRGDVGSLQIQTPKGMVDVLPNSAHSAYVKVEGTVTIRGIALNASCGFEIKNGEILSHYESGPNSAFRFKANRHGQFMVEAPDGATRELMEIMRGAVKTAFETEPGRFAEAGLIYASNTIFRLDQDIAKAEKALRDLIQLRTAALTEEQEMERLVELHATRPAPTL